jgi:hypothetical protein
MQPMGMAIIRQRTRQPEMKTGICNMPKNDWRATRTDARKAVGSLNRLE